MRFLIDMATINLKERLLEIGFSGTPEEAERFLKYIGLPKEITHDTLETLLALNACTALPDISRVNPEEPASVARNLEAVRIAVALFPSGSEIRVPKWLKPVFDVAAQMTIKDVFSWIEEQRQTTDRRS